MVPASVRIAGTFLFGDGEMFSMKAAARRKNKAHGSKPWESERETSANGARE